MDMLEKIKHAAAFIDGRTSGFRPEVGIILGTGLGGLVDHIANRHSTSGRNPEVRPTMKAAACLIISSLSIIR